MGETFTSVKNTSGNGGQTYSRQRVFALDADTGVVDPGFAPTVDGEVAAVAASPDGNVFIAGNFNTVNGQARRGFAKLNPDTGALVSGFTTVANGRVRTMVVRGTTVYLGGNFGKLGGINRDRLGAVNALTGAVSTELNLPVTQSYTAGSGRNVWRLDVTPNGDRLVIVGNFRVVGNQTRVQVAMINLTTSPDTVAPWNTTAWDAGTCASRFKEYPRDVEFSPDGSYFAIVSTGAGYWPQTLCDTLTRWPTYSTSSNVGPDWIDYTGGDTLFSVGVTGSAVYAGGHQRWMNAEAVGDQERPEPSRDQASRRTIPRTVFHSTGIRCETRVAWASSISSRRVRDCGSDRTRAASRANSIAASHSSPRRVGMCRRWVGLRRCPPTSTAWDRSPVRPSTSRSCTGSTPVAGRSRPWTAASTGKPTAVRPIPTGTRAATPRVGAMFRPCPDRFPPPPLPSSPASAGIRTTDRNSSGISRPPSGGKPACPAVLRGPMQLHVQPREPGLRRIDRRFDGARQLRHQRPARPRHGRDAELRHHE